MKMRKVMLAAVTAMVLVTGCSSDGQQETEMTTVAQEMESQEAEAPEIEIKESETQETEAQETETTATEAAQTSGEAETETEPAETEQVEAENASGKYEDNFAVSTEAAAEFGSQVKAAVAEKDLEKLADLTAYPVYVGFPEGSMTIESREDMIAQGAEKIFTQELIDSVGAADETALIPSMAGFVLSDGGKTNIIFAVSDGDLAIVGINY